MCVGKNLRGRIMFLVIKKKNTAVKKGTGRRAADLVPTSMVVTLNHWYCTSEAVVKVIV